MEFKQIKAIEKTNKERLLRANPSLTEDSGIYFLLREEEGFKYAYIGQAHHILSRLASHFMGYQHIDLSLKKHGLYSVANPTGYRVHFLPYPEAQLDKREKEFILKYANAGYQMRNATSGSQGEGKRSLDNGKPTKGYLEGLHNGYLNARKDIAHLFDLHLTVSTKKQPPTKNQEKALQKFKDFLDYANKM